MKKNSALTLIEILLVVTILGTISIPLYISYTRTQANQSLKSSSTLLVNTLRSAHGLAREAKDQKSWAVKRKDPTTYQLVAGNKSTFSVQKEFKLETFVTLPNDFIVWFDIGTGDTDSDKNITIENKYGRKITININKTGVVELSETP